MADASGSSTPVSGGGGSAFGTWGRRGGWRRPVLAAAAARQISTESPSFTAFESVSARPPAPKTDVFSMSTIEESRTDYRGVGERTKMM